MYDISYGQSDGLKKTWKHNVTNYIIMFTQDIKLKLGDNNNEPDTLACGAVFSIVSLQKKGNMKLKLTWPVMCIPPAPLHIAMWCWSLAGCLWRYLYGAPQACGTWCVHSDSFVPVFTTAPGPHTKGVPATGWPYITTSWCPGFGCNKGTELKKIWVPGALTRLDLCSHEV